MAISRAQLLKELLPGLNALFGMEYARYGEEHKEIYETEKSERSFEEETKLAGFAAAPVKNEGSAIAYDNAQEAWSTRYNHETIALGFSITEEAIEDNLYDSLSARYTKSLARAMAYTKQVKAASVINNGFNGSYLGGDGVTLFGNNSSSVRVGHPLVNGGVLHVPEEMSDHDALERARQEMPDQNIMSVREQEHYNKTGFIPGAKSAFTSTAAQALRAPRLCPDPGGAVALPLRGGLCAALRREEPGGALCGHHPGAPRRHGGDDGGGSRVDIPQAVVFADTQDIEAGLICEACHLEHLAGSLRRADGEAGMRVGNDVVVARHHDAHARSRIGDGHDRSLPATFRRVVGPNEVQAHLPADLGLPVEQQTKGAEQNLQRECHVGAAAPDVRGRSRGRGGREPPRDRGDAPRQ